MNEHMDFVIIANAWAAGIDNPTSKHQIARELVRQGHRALWLEGAGMRRPSLGSGADRGRIVRRLRAAVRGAVRPDSGDVPWVLSPLLFPFPSLPRIRRINGWVYARCARRWAKRLGFDDPVLVNYVPVLAESMRDWPGKVVYHCVDRWDAFAMYDSAMMAEMHQRCCRYADVVIASAHDLVERCRTLHGNVHHVSHGVDYEHFSAPLHSDTPARPADLPPAPVVGFFGLVSEWVDQDLLVRLAREAPEVSLVIIGKADVATDRLRGQRNIFLLGPRPFRDLPAYVAGFQVGIIPFVVNDLTRAVNPIKLREMLAGGCPVVSTDLPEVAVYGALPGVDVTDSAGSFVRAVRKRSELPLSPAHRREISAAVRGETWEAKVNEILNIVSSS